MIRPVAWYKEWFGEEYLELYAHRDRGEAERHVDFVQARFGGERPRAVLDLACGAGRHTAALRQRGCRALGVDLSLTLLSQSPELPRVAGDMRCLPFADATFDWVLNFFTSFGYFESERENFRVLEEMVRVMRPGGRFLIDLFNIDRVLATTASRCSRASSASAGPACASTYRSGRSRASSTAWASPSSPRRKASWPDSRPGARRSAARCSATSGRKRRYVTHR